MLEETFIMVVYAICGAVMRISWGVWKAEESLLNLKLSWKRLAYEFFVSCLFGIFGGQLMTDLGMVKVGIDLATMISSLMGANVVEVIVKKFGLTKNMEVIVSDQQINTFTLNIHEANAIEFLKTNGKITNKIYQRINQTTHDVARNELNFLVRKRKLKRIGNSKSTYYILV